MVGGGVEGCKCQWLVLYFFFLPRAGQQNGACEKKPEEGQNKRRPPAGLALTRQPGRISVVQRLPLSTQCCCTPARFFFFLAASASGCGGSGQSAAAVGARPSQVPATTRSGMMMADRHG